MRPLPLATERFETFGPDHLALLGLAVVGCVVVAAVGNRRRRRLRARGVEPSSPSDGLQRAHRVAAITLLAVAVPLQVWQWLPADYDRQTSWPVHLCDLAWMLAVVALWTGSRRAAQVLYYWGLTLVPQAMLTPDLAQVFPHPRYVGFWLLHLLVVWIAVHLTWGAGHRPTWSGYRFTVAATVVWMAAVMAFNTVFDTNYGYLNGKPARSVLDLLPEWPTYVVVQVVVVAAVWALMTWPWTRRSPARIGSGQGSGGRMAGL